MRKLRRLLFRLLLFALIIIIGIMIIRTLNFSSKQIQDIEAIKLFPLEKKSIEHLAQAIQIPTISNNIDSSAYRNFDTLLQRTYLQVHQELERTVINEFSYIYKWAGTNPRLEPILLMGHSDVVPVEEASRDRWDADPFGGQIDENLLYGRGTLDDKINIIGILEACEKMLQEGFAPTRDIYFAFGHDEEVLGKYGAKAIVQYFKDNNLRFEYVLDEGQMVLNKAMGGLEQPLAMIGISEKGYATLTLTAQLEDGGHSSMPPPETAVSTLTKAINTLVEHPFPMKVDGATAALFEHVGPEMTIFNKTLFANLWLTKGLIKSQLSKDPAASAIMRTTTAPTMLRGGVKENVLPTRASAKINFRIIPGETVESVKAYVEDVINDKRIIVQIDDPENSTDPAPLSSTDSFGFRVLQRTIKEIFPEAVVAPSLVIAATDSRYYVDVSDNIYRFQPLQLDRSDLKRFHGINEAISLDNYQKAINFYYQLIKNSSK